MFNHKKAQELVKRDGRTTIWLARYLHCTDQTIRGYLNGKLKPSASMVKLLSIALDCPEEDLYLPSKTA